MIVDGLDVATREEIEQACDLLARACVSEGHLTDEAIEARRPGASEQYADASAMAWVSFYGWLQRHHATPPAATAGTEDGLTARQALQQMLHAEPVAVTLELDSKDAPLPKYPNGMRVAVHPKNPYSLRWLDSLDVSMHHLALAAQRCLALDVPSDVHVLRLVPLSESFAVRLWAWVLTTPGPALPFDPYSSETEDPPEWTMHLSWVDLLTLYTTNKQIHHARHQLVGNAYGSKDRGGATSRLPLEGFLATFASENGGFGRPSDVLERWSLGEMMALAIAKSDLDRQARKRAEAEAEEKKRRGGR